MGRNKRNETLLRMNVNSQNNCHEKDSPLNMWGFGEF